MADPLNFTVTIWNSSWLKFSVITNIYCEGIKASGHLTNVVMCFKILFVLFLLPLFLLTNTVSHYPFVPYISLHKTILTRLARQCTPLRQGQLKRTSCLHTSINWPSSRDVRFIDEILLNVYTRQSILHWGHFCFCSYLVFVMCL